ncbi:MAG: prepilin-type N-terminal cleavage/methylation domain-containing protein [Sedimentisphaerales bacterium]|nr:prepilin-type N-terminal cleavage/methylation domain-containing protein [Sedimentisphaerales bacterium]
MKRKGFTLVELLVVIAIIALLMGILMPALSRVRQIAFRMVCGTNLSGIGKAMLIYSNDYDDEFPRAGGRDSKWGSPVQWMADNRYTAYGLNTTNGSGGQATISSSFYLLVKYAEVTPKSFVCKADSGITEFKPSEYGAGDRELIDLWDFGPESVKHCSYSYHMPYGLYALTTSSEPGMAVAADRNPWITNDVSEGKDATKFAEFNPTGDKEYVNIGNAIAHQEDGQNVLFMDNHVGFEKNSFCGINDDNIYTYMDGSNELRKGLMPAAGTSVPVDRLDSLLVNDGKDTGPKPRACFPADTPVWVEGKLIRISEATYGRMVNEPDRSQKVLCLRQIERVEEHEGIFECRDVVLENGSCISVVDVHFFMLDSGRWIAAPNLRSGMKLKTMNGAVAIKNVVLRAAPFIGKVYNLKIQDSEQYLVGKDGVIVRDW